MNSNDKLQISHKVHDLVENLFLTKGIIVHTRGKVDCPTYGNVDKSEVDVVAEEYISICCEAINSIVQSATDDARLVQKQSTQKAIRKALGFNDMYR